nr:unnamed protein product [Callosobruchus analis]
MSGEQKTALAFLGDKKALVIVCLTFKRVTDDEATRLFLYLQKLSRQWSLLSNVTWSRVGAAVADATYGGYLIITAALFIGRLAGELPTKNRITEYVLLGVGAVLFIALGSLSYAALDSVPPDLVDNAAVVGTVSLVTAGLFLLDMAGPKAKKTTGSTQMKSRRLTLASMEPKRIPRPTFDVEREVERSERTQIESVDSKNGNGVKNGISNGNAKTNNNKREESETRKNGKVEDRRGIYPAEHMSELDIVAHNNGTVPVFSRGNSESYIDVTQSTERVARRYHQMKDDLPKRFGIYGKDVTDGFGSETDDTEELRMPPAMESHSPVWSNIRKGRHPMGQYGRYDIVSTPIILPQPQREIEEFRPPSRPGDPGYVQYTAQHWGGKSTSKTPRHSPTEISNTGRTSSSINSDTCSAALPMYVEGSNKPSRSPRIGLKYGSALTLSRKSLSFPNCFT